MENKPNNQPYTMPPPAPVADGPTPKKSKRKLIVAGVLLVLVVIAAISSASIVKKSKSSTNITDSGTHTVARADDLKFGQNRAVNPCNVMPAKLLEASYGKLSGNTLVQEQYQMADVANNIIDADNGVGSFSCFREATPAGGNVTLNLTGFRSREAAQKYYAKNTKDLTRKAFDQQAISGLQAKGGVADSRAEIIGIHDNYQYEFIYSGDLDAQSLAQLTAVAKRTVENMDDSSVSTRPASVPRVTVAGKVLPDTCQLFSDTVFEQQVLARNKDITSKYPYAQKASPVGVKRSYIVQVSPPATEPVAQTGPLCSRRNGTRPEASNLSSSESFERISDELTLPTVNSTVQLEFDNSVEQAQRSLRVYSQNGGAAVSGIGDEAYFSGAGAGGELTQLVVRKGTVLMTIQTQTEGGSCRNGGAGCNASAEDYTPLAKALVARLP